MTTDQATATIKACGCPDLERGLSRRSFLKRAGLFGLVAGIAHETAFTQFAFGATPYAGDVLVVLSLRGGFDGLQAIVPAADPDYPMWRPNIGIPGAALIPLDATFGMHPAMASLQSFWDDGTFGVVHAVGMAEPNRSHFAAMDEMERAAPGSSLRTGWIDRMLGTRMQQSEFQAVQMGGSMAPASFLGPKPELAMWSVDSFGLDAAWDAGEMVRWDEALRGLQNGAPASLSAPALGALNALGIATQVQATPYVPANLASYPDTDLGHALTDVARLIKADVGMQVAAVDYGDWDMHEGMGDVDAGWMVDHLTELSGAISAFATDLGAEGMAGVSLVSLTEFGRCVMENGSGGTDHGYGQVVMLMGGGIKGGQVHGTWPGLAEQDLVGGDLAATTDYRTILAELLEKRCGASASDIGAVFPDLDSARPDVATQI